MAIDCGRAARLVLRDGVLLHHGALGGCSGQDAGRLRLQLAQRLLLGSRRGGRPLRRERDLPGRLERDIHRARLLEWSRSGTHLGDLLPPAVHPRVRRRSAGDAAARHGTPRHGAAAAPDGGRASAPAGSADTARTASAGTGCATARAASASAGTGCATARAASASTRAGGAAASASGQRPAAVRLVLTGSAASLTSPADLERP